MTPSPANCRQFTGSRRFRWGVVGACSLVVLAGGSLTLRAEPPAPAQGVRLVRPLAGEDLFTNGTVRQVRVELGPEALAALRKDPRGYVSAQIRDGDTTYAGVEIHLKGSTGSFRPLDDKPGLTLKFDPAQPGGTFHGLPKIHLNNSVEDPSYMNEHLGAELFRAAGIPAPRVAYANVTMNGRPLGLYVLKEGFTEDFLAGYYHDTSGNLYEPQDGHDVDEPMKRHSGRGSKKDQSDLQALAAATREPDLEKRWEGLGAVLDRDEFLTFAIMEVMVCHRDGYSLARNNFRVYHDRDSDKIVFLPHGMDQLFGRADLPWQPRWAGQVAEALLNTPAGRRRYREQFQELFAKTYDAKTLAHRIDGWLLELRPALAAGDFAAVEREATVVKQRVANRQSFLAAQIHLPEPAFLEFTGGTAHLTGWQAGEAPAGGGLREGKSPDGLRTLTIQAGPVTSTGWRTSALLRRGHSRFSGQVMVTGVKPLPFGKHQGASLRVSGRTGQSREALGDSPWQEVDTEFAVAAEQETVELVCELRASAGQACWAIDSLGLRQIPLTARNNPDP